MIDAAAQSRGGKIGSGVKKFLQRQKKRGERPEPPSAMTLKRRKGHGRNRPGHNMEALSSSITVSLSLDGQESLVLARRRPTPRVR